MVLTLQQQYKIAMIAFETDAHRVPQFLVDFVCGLHQVSMADVRLLIRSVNWGQGSPARFRLLENLVQRGRAFWVCIVVTLRSPKFADSLEQFLCPLVLRFLVSGVLAAQDDPGVPDLMAQPMLHGRIDTLEVKRITGDYPYGVLYADDLVRTQDFWRSWAEDQVIKVYCTLRANLQQDLTVTRLACTVNGEVLHHASLEANDNREVCLSAIRNNFMAYRWASNRLCQTDTVFITQVAQLLTTEQLALLNPILMR